MNNELSSDELYKSFVMAEMFIDKQYAEGKISREEAHKMRAQARKNYKNQNYNRQLEKCSGIKR